MTNIKNFCASLINSKKTKHLTKFSCVGCLNTLIDFILFSVLNSLLGVNYVTSQVVSYGGGTLNSYLCNKFWTFTDTRQKKKTTSEIVQFIVVNSASLGVSLIVLSVLMGNKSINSFLAKILSMVLAQVVNFLGYRFLVFGKADKSKFFRNKIA
ncbi:MULTISPECIES: GtrA family protein [Clostridium]|uniref:GtrA family protein n=1 Tax=Clostridium TaxID=1485 RepID=UPI0008265005|nr:MULTISPECIES: GtrA family protein [Clostridium]PJI07316.1 GtrA family protein [Clostridium sp. CT7]